MRSKDALERRKYLKALGGSSVFALAGCLGGDEGNGDSGNGDSGNGDNGNGDSGNGDNGGNGDSGAGETELRDPVFTTADNAPVHEAQWNPFVPRGSSRAYQYLYEFYIELNQVTQDFVPGAIQDIEPDGTEVQLQLRDGLTFHTGDDVTTQDLATNFKLDAYFGSPLADFIDDPSEDIVEGDDGIVVTLTDPLGSSLVTQLVDTHGSVSHPHDVYAEFIEAMDDATTEEELDDARSQLVDEPMSSSMAFGAGPYELEEMQQDRIILSKFDEYPAADQLNIPTVEVRGFADRNVLDSAWQNDALDGRNGNLSEQVLEQIPDHINHLTVSDYWGLSTAFNHENKHLGRRKIRQAIAHLQPRVPFAQLDFNADPLPSPTGLHGWGEGVPQNWLTDDVMENFPTYATDEPNYDEATRLFEEEGYTKDGDRWVDPDGEVVELPYIMNAGADKYELFTSIMQDFGIETSISTLGGAETHSRIEESNDFALTRGYTWMAGKLPHPYFHFRFLFRSDRALKGWQYPENPTAPPVGEPDGDEVEYDIDALLNEIATSDTEGMTDAVQKLAWLTAFDLPYLILRDRLGQFHYDTQDFEWPDEDDPKMAHGWPDWVLLRTGDLRARPQ